MLFSSITFLYYFLPIVIILYFILPFKFKNLVLLISSLFFYFWGEPKYLASIIILSILGYVFGRLIDKYRDKKLLAKALLILAITLFIGTLGFFKYTDFLIENINTIFNTNIELLRIALPIGISFYTFQILSYVIDLYWGKTKVQRNLINFMAYVTMFPQLIAGPIVRYSDVAAELDERTISFGNCAYGINRFIIGLSKKILLANVLGEFCNIVKSVNEQSIIFMWMYVIAYALHIYFDFSGYSDMAIGLGKIFGFNFPENFNYPYISKSITEFWRRWHMTLGTWFRDYVYIPLGGNRVSKIKWFRNILIVWGLTGLWHGASWNFVIWGLLFAVFLILEKAFLYKWLEKIPEVFSRIYTLVIVLVSWIIFDATSMQEITSRLAIMFGLGDVPLINSESVYYIKSYLTIFVIALFAATPIAKNILNKVKENKLLNVMEPMVQIVLLTVITAYLIDGSFNPFLYFRF